MGGGVSAPSVNRLRKTIVIRAYNLRKKDETLDEQLRPFATRSTSTNKLCLSLDNVKTCLQLEDGSLWTSIENLLVHCASPALRSEGIDYDVFIAFLESGQIPLQRLSSSASAGNILIERVDIVGDVDASIKHKAGQSLPNPIPRSKVHRTDLRVDTITGDTHEDSAAVPLASPHPYLVEPADSPEPQQQPKEQQAFFAAGRKVEDNALIVSGKDSSGHALHRQSGKPLWKKKETTKVERTIEYTTIDSEGVLQELLEHEITETEVLHLECKETGEFAHRETKEFQQKEVFNKEVVSEQVGMEEYVHLKSVDDEIEYMESTMPQKQPQEPEREREDAEHGATATEAQRTAEEGGYDQEETYEEYLYRQAMASAQAEAEAEAAREGYGDSDRLDGEAEAPRVRAPPPSVRPAPPRRPPQEAARGCYGDIDVDDSEVSGQAYASSSGGGGRSAAGLSVEACGDDSEGDGDGGARAARSRSGSHGTVEGTEADQDNRQQQQQRLQQRMHMFDPASPSSLEASRRRERSTGNIDDDDDDSRRDKHETQEDAAVLSPERNDAGGSDLRGSMADID